MLPPDFHLTIEARVERRALLGGEPFAIVHLGEDAARRIRAWQEGAPVGDGGALARELVHANLAQPHPPPAATVPPVTAVIPVKDRSLTRLLAALEVDEVIVVDDGSQDDRRVRAEAKAAGAHYVRHDTSAGAAAARNTGLAVASHDVVACIDSDCVPLPGWLDPLLPHFQDPLLEAIAPRIVPLAQHGLMGRYEAARSPLDRGPAPARVIPYGRVPFVPGAAIVVRRHVRFDETLRGGEDVELVWRLPYVRYEPAGHVAHDHRTDPRRWFARRVYYGRTAAAIAKRHPGNARPLNVSPWTTAAWVALAARRPGTAAAITATATALLAKDLRGIVPDPFKTASQLAGLGTLQSGRVLADAVTRQYWPLALARPRVLLAAALADPPKFPDAVAYGLGVWLGCVQHRSLDPLLPAKPWRLLHRYLS